MTETPTFDINSFDADKLQPKVGSQYRLAGIDGRFRLESVELSYDGFNHCFKVEFLRLREVNDILVKPLTVVFIGGFANAER